jgi:hypothetical protein
VCPFCPDREHKYPRPDNLQRYSPIFDACFCDYSYCIKRFSRNKANEIFSGMLEFTMWTKIKMIPNSEMSSHRDQKDQVEGEGEEEELGDLYRTCYRCMFFNALYGHGNAYGAGRCRLHVLGTLLSDLLSFGRNIGRILLLLC